MHAFTRAIEVFEEDIVRITALWASEGPLSHWAIVARDEQLGQCLFGIDLLHAAYEEEVRELHNITTKVEQEAVQSF